MRHRVPIALLTVFLALSPALPDDDPWALPEPEGVGFMLVITESERTYNIILADEVPEYAAGPARVELSLTASDTRVLDRCRRTIEEGRHEEAEKILDRLVTRNAANHDATMLRAKCRLARGETDAALGDLRASLIGNRRNPAAWKLLEELAGKTERKVVRPGLEPPAWIRPPDAKDEVEIGYVTGEMEADFPWLYYVAGRAVYRHEGGFARDFPKEKGYRPTFRELLYGLGAALKDAAGRKKIGAGLSRLLEEKKQGTLLPFAFYALYTEPIPEKPERDFEKLRPRLVEYFDEHVLVEE